jgi:hypothetical protein
MTVGLRSCDRFYENGTLVAMADLLRGAQLVVADYENYLPYSSSPNRSLASWFGYDRDLLDELSSLLGFSYNLTIIETAGYTYEQQLHNELDERGGDLILTYWNPTSARRATTMMLTGHRTNNRVLYSKKKIGNRAARTDSLVWERMMAVKRPFSDGLWLTLGCLFIVNMLATYAVEYDNPDFECESTRVGKLLHSLCALLPPFSSYLRSLLG